MVRWHRCLFTANLFTSVLAGINIISPEAGARIQAEDVLTVRWTESGTDPSLSDLTSYSIFLCAGSEGEGNHIIVKPLVTNVDFSDQETSSASSTIEASLGESIDAAYFIKMISTFPGGSLISFSGRFSISGMAGSFPFEVKSVLQEDIAQSGTEQKEILKRADTPGKPAADAADANVAYSLQTGPIRYAPMPEWPPVKITAKEDPKPLYPTSKVKIAKTPLPTPVAEETITVSQTFSTKSRENTAKPQPKPTEGEMQKFLNRWRD